MRGLLTQLREDDAGNRAARAARKAPQPVTVASVTKEVRERYPVFAERRRLQPVLEALARETFEAWEADGSPRDAQGLFAERFLEAAVTGLIERLRRRSGGADSQNLLQQLQSRDRGPRSRR